MTCLVCCGPTFAGRCSACNARLAEDLRRRQGLPTGGASCPADYEDRDDVPKDWPWPRAFWTRRHGGPHDLDSEASPWQEKAIRDMEDQR